METNEGRVCQEKRCPGCWLTLRKVAVEAIVVLEFIRASRTQSVFASSATQMAGDLHDVITDALACIEVANPSAVARQVSVLIAVRMAAQLYSFAKSKRGNE